VVVAKGEAEIGMQQINVILPVAGADYVGLLPERMPRAWRCARGDECEAVEQPCFGVLLETDVTMRFNGLVPMLQTDDMKRTRDCMSLCSDSDVSRQAVTVGVV
jgi:hypothetical protein